MNIIVLATAARIGGAKTIYNQFVSHLPEYVGSDKYYVFVDPTVVQPEIDGVTYVQDDNHSWTHRIAWDFWGFKRWVKKSGVRPDVIVSLQNTGVIYDCKSVVYYHQSLPFYQEKWSPFKAKERSSFLYKNVYPWFVKRTIRKNTQVVVQIPFIKKGFVKTFRHPEKNVHVLFPDMQICIPADGEEDGILRKSRYFVYPANGMGYKQHRTIIKALTIAKGQHPELASRLKVVFTLDKQKNAELHNFVLEQGCENNLEFAGQMSHDALLRLVKNSCGLLFPSTIETLGLPLLEAAAMGKPIIASDRDYAHEVLLDYPGAKFLPYDDYAAWSDEIVKLYEAPSSFPPIKERKSSWGDFFKLISG